jgi:hypothetical protein
MAVGANQFNRRTLFTLLMLNLLNFVSIPANAAAPRPEFQSLQQALDRAHYAKAWQQAQALNDRYEGDAYFDYLYGLAALENQQLDYALLALKRAVTHDPQLVRARLELARTYVLLNNLPAALSEFKEALEFPLPAPVRRNVQAQIQELATPTATSASAWQSSMNLAIGHDNNVNLGLSNASISLPIFGEVTLDKASVRQDSMFSEWGAQLGYNRVQDPKQAWLINSRISSKHYPHASAYHTQELGIQAGKFFIDGAKRYQLGLNLQALHLNNQAYSYSKALEAGLNYQLATDKNWLSGLSWTKTDYQQTSHQNQNNQTIQFSQQYQIQQGSLGEQWGVAISHEIPARTRFNYLNRDVLSLGYGLSQTWNSRQSSSLGINLQRRINQAEDLSYKTKRKDTRLTLQLSHQMQLTNKTTLFTHIGYMDNLSNLELYNSKKAFIKLGLTHQF